MQYCAARLGSIRMRRARTPARAVTPANGARFEKQGTKTAPRSVHNPNECGSASNAGQRGPIPEDHTREEYKGRIKRNHDAELETLTIKTTTAMLAACALAGLCVAPVRADDKNDLKHATAHLNRDLNKASKSANRDLNKASKSTNRDVNKASKSTNRDLNRASKSTNRDVNRSSKHVNRQTNNTSKNVNHEVNRESKDVNHTAQGDPNDKKHKG